MLNDEIPLSGLASPCSQPAMAFTLLRPAEAVAASVPAPTPASAPEGPAVRVRRCSHGGSVFIDDEYLIKGVAGAIAWNLAKVYVPRGRTEFTNRELRLSSDLRLPDIQDNLEVRLVLLQRRLAERASVMPIVEADRGRFRLDVLRPLVSDEVADAAG